MDEDGSVVAPVLVSFAVGAAMAYLPVCAAALARIDRLAR